MKRIKQIMKRNEVKVILWLVLYLIYDTKNEKM